MEPWIELLVLAGAAARAAAVLGMPAARRELRGRPVLVGIAIAGGLVAVVLILWAAIASIALLRATTLAVALAWALAAWRARPAYGRRRGLPPGSLGLGPSLRAIVDPQFYTNEARRHGPVFKMAQFHRPVVCVLGLERGRRVLRDHEDALVPPPLPLAREVPRGFLRYMSPEDHARYARLFRAAFSDAALAAVAPMAAREADRAFAALAAAGPGVGPHELLHEHVLVVLLRLFFGDLLRPEDHTAVAAFACDADYASAVGRPSVRARDALRGFERLVQARRAAYDARDDPSVWGEIVRLDPVAAGDRTVVGNLFLMLLAAWDSIGCLVCWTVQLLGTAPRWVDAARRISADAGDDPFARAVLEALRLAQSEYVYREVRRPIAIDGFAIPRGWFFRLLVAESHRLDPPFDRPDVFDPDRHRNRRFVTAEFAPFGFDQHACLGARTTLAVARSFAERLIRGYTWTVVDDGPRERGNRHWNHWQPNARFRIALAPHAENPS